MKQVLMITGHLAALKSTLAFKLGKDLKILALSKDQIKEVLGDTIGFKNREENLKLSHATFKLISSMMKQALEVADQVIIESNFRDYEVQEIKDYCNLHHYKLHILFLTGDPSILYQRYLDRQPLRHTVHVSTGTLDFETFQAVMKPFDPLLYGDDASIIDTSFFMEKEYLDLLNQLKIRINTN